MLKWVPQCKKKVRVTDLNPSVYTKDLGKLSNSQDSIPTNNHQRNIKRMGQGLWI